MGMEVRIAMEAVDAATARRAATAAFAVIAALDRRLSDYRADSDLRAIERAAPSALVVDADVMGVLTRAIPIAQLTEGAFDPTVAPLVALWREARASRQLPSPQAIAAARALVGWARVDLDQTRSTVRLPAPGMRLDLGGIAKGYILQRAMETLRVGGAPVALIEAGGDLVAGDPPPGAQGWPVQVGCVPRLRSEPPGSSPAVLLRNEALATSGAAAQFVDIDGVRYSHVVDPRTGLGLARHQTVHVRARDGATADAWATALSVLGSARAPALSIPEGVRYCFVVSDGVRGLQLQRRAGG